MKKAILFITAFATMQSVNAQFYVQARGGYAFRTAVGFVNGISDLNNDDKAESGIQIESWNMETQLVEKSNEAIYGTGGQGATTSLAAGYMFTKHFGAELAVHYFESERSNPQHTEKVLATVDNPPRLVADFYAKSQQVRVAPSLIVRGELGKVAPYVRFGLLIPVAGQVKVDAKTVIGAEDNSTERVETDLKVVLNGAFSLGYNTAFGVSVPLAPHTSVYLETELITLNVRPAKSTIISGEQRSYSAQVNTSTTDLNEISLTNTVYKREKVYVDKLTNTSNNEFQNPSYDATKPKEELLNLTNYNSLGIHLGLRYGF